MTALLGGLDPATFLRRHWQKRPLLIRQALPGFRGIVDRDALIALANRSDATSRLVIHHPRRRRKPWERHDGPFLGLTAESLPARDWTLLVHGIESLVPGGWDLLRPFNFIPAARIDDLMVSYAADGGSVGPHDDRYDVFLLQGPGQRTWKIETGGKRDADENAGIRVLKSFSAETEWTLEPGDMLYLPPGVAHHGVAVGPCFTYSIGFLAPSHRDLLEQFCSFLGTKNASEVDAEALIADPDLLPARHPMHLPAHILGQVTKLVSKLRVRKDDVAEFLGRFLTMPRPHSVFVRPGRPRSESAFAERLALGHGQIALALPSRGLIDGRRLFLNGRVYRADTQSVRLFSRLFAARLLLLPVRAPRAAIRLLHEFYEAGDVVLSRNATDAGRRAS